MAEALTELHQILIERFSEDELRTLSFRLGVDYDVLPGEGKVGKARELIIYLERRDVLTRLLEVGEQLRPDISWSQRSKSSEPGLGVITGRSPWSRMPGSEIAVRFTPKSYPARLSKIRFYVTSTAKPWTRFEVRIYDDDNDGEPGSRLNRGRIFSAGKLGEEWIELDVSEQNIVISEGDFFVSMVWTTAPGRRGKNAQFLGAVDNKLIPGRTYFKFGVDGEWILKNDKNCMVQAFVNDDVIIDNV